MLVFDSRLPGFGLRVAESGAKIFIVQYNRGRRTKRLMIGRYGAVTAAEARKKALEVIGQIQSGTDPLAERESARAAALAAKAEEERAAAARHVADAFTVSVLLDTWKAVQLKDRSENYRREGPRAVRHLLGGLVDAPASFLTAAAVQLIVDQRIRTAPVQVINARAYGRAAWGWAMKRNLVAVNPFADVVIERRVKSRDRVLSDVELAEAWRAAGAQPFPFGPMIRLLILTLQRRAEVAGIRWSEISNDLSVWTIPAARAKNNRAHVVHLAAPAKKILQEALGREEAARAEAELKGYEIIESDLIFTTTRVTPSSGLSKARRALNVRITKERNNSDTGARRSPADWKFHDFRRTGVSKMAELSIPPHVADRVLNHVTGSIQGVAAVYQRFEFLPERKNALNVWAAHVLALAKGESPKSNVLEISKALDKRRGSRT